jgi:hypothetical protein
MRISVSSTLSVILFRVDPKSVFQLRITLFGNGDVQDYGRGLHSVRPHITLRAIFERFRVLVVRQVGLQKSIAELPKSPQIHTASVTDLVQGTHDAALCGAAQELNAHLFHFLTFLLVSPAMIGMITVDNITMTIITTNNSPANSILLLQPMCETQRVSASIVGRMKNPRLPFRAAEE